MLTENNEKLTRKKELIEKLKDADGNNPTEDQILAAAELGLTIVFEAFDKVWYEPKVELEEVYLYEKKHY